MAEANKQQTAQASQHHSIMDLLPASAALTNSCRQRATDCKVGLGDQVVGLLADLAIGARWTCLSPG